MALRDLIPFGNGSREMALQRNEANPFFARLGVLFGKTRVGFVLEPLGSTIASDFPHLTSRI